MRLPFAISCGSMAKDRISQTGTWNFRDIPRHVMQRVKMAAAYEGKTVKDLLIEWVEVKLTELERKGILPRAK